MRNKIFKTELEYIKNEQVRKLTEKALEKLPNYFFECSASSTNKFHPSYAVGEGGLVRHTKAAVYIANDLLNLEYNNIFSNDEKDIILASLILHDGLKHGFPESKFTIATHPTEMANWLKDDNDLNKMIETDLFEIMLRAISSHMGQWNTDYRSKKEILPKPKTDIEKFVHMCDYLASRKYLLFDFGDDYYKPSDFQSNELDVKIKEIINLCKEKIAENFDRDKLYGIIAQYNDDKKNPNSIKDINVAQSIIEAINNVQM